MCETLLPVLKHKTHKRNTFFLCFVLCVLRTSVQPENETETKKIKDEEEVK